MLRCNEYAFNLRQEVMNNNYFRKEFWTGEHLQLTLMSIPVDSSIGLENHPHTDQLLYIEQGQGLVMMGSCKGILNYQKMVYEDFSIVIPAGTWHNIINVGNCPLKLFSIYAPPQHPPGTIHRTKEEAEAAEKYDL